LSTDRVCTTAGHLKKSSLMQTQKKLHKPKNERTLKIYPHYRTFGYDAKIVPEIRLCGKWLQQFGFNPDKWIKIIGSEKQLIIRPDNSKRESND
jgi:toxic protein SymE